MNEKIKITSKEDREFINKELNKIESKEPIEGTAKPQYVSIEDEEEDYEFSEEEEEEIDFSGWKQASHEDLDDIRALKTPKEIKVVLNKEKKIFITVFLKDITADQELVLFETFFTMDDKTKFLKMNWSNYYKKYWAIAVKKTIPSIKYRDLKGYNSRFLGILSNIFPSPFTLGGASGSKIKAIKRKN